MSPTSVIGKYPTAAFKLLEMAQKRWRRINRYQMLEKVVDENVDFEDGEEVERSAA